MADATPSNVNIAPATLALSVALGLFHPALAAYLNDYVFIALFFIVTFSLNTAGEPPLRILASIDKKTGIFILWKMIVIPAVVMVLCIAFDVDAVLTSILLASCAAGSVFASPTLAKLVNLDRKIAVRSMVGSTLLMPIPLIVFGNFAGVFVSGFSLSTFAWQVFYFLVTPLAISVLFTEAMRHTSNKTGRIVNETMQGGALLAVIVFCIGVLHNLHGDVPGFAEKLIAYAFLAAIISILMHVATVTVFSEYGPQVSLTFGMLAANRNVALSVALLGTAVPPDVLIYLAIVQIPIFMSPFIMQIALALIAAGKDARDKTSDTSIG